MSPILFGGSENRDESGRYRPVEDSVSKERKEYSKHALKPYDDRYHRAVQRTFYI